MRYQIDIYRRDGEHLTFLHNGERLGKCSDCDEDGVIYDEDGDLYCDDCLVESYALLDSMAEDEDEFHRTGRH